MRRNIILSALLTLSALGMQAQSGHKSFDEWRQSLLQNYENFRQGILADYDKFLDGEWVEYKSLRSPDRIAEPKPEAAPSLADSSAAPTPVVLSVADVNVNDAENDSIMQASSGENRETNSVAILSDEDISARLHSELRSEAVDLTNHSLSDIPRQVFDFYGMEFSIPAVDLSSVVTDGRLRRFGKRWKSLAKHPDAEFLVRALKTEASAHGLNDFLTFDMVRAYVASVFPEAHSTSRMSLVHFIMANLGYDARLATDGKGNGVILLPFEQTVYGHPMMEIKDRTYYVYSDIDAPQSDEFDRIKTCKLPDNAKLGDKLDLRMGELHLPYKAHHFSFGNGNIRVEGEINANIFPLLYRYPQMPVNDYATSVIAPEVRADIVEQLRRQVGDLPLHQGVDSLLRLVQFAFEYKTDQQSHGFEKPYFFEETLFYPTCDCEDRAIFYTYLLWNVLGVENHVIGYPGHEAASVCLDKPIPGVEYEFRAKHFLISDPTYLGSRTGMCMGRYENTSPSIDHIYDAR